MSTQSEPLSLETLIDLELPGDPRISADGQRVAFVLSKSHKPDKDTPHQKSIHILDVASTDVQQIIGTESGTNESPRWSPDGSRLVYLSNRAAAAEMQLYLYTRDGGTAPLTDLRGCVDAPAWSPDGRLIAFLYDGEREGKRPDADPVVVDALPVFRRIWTIDVQTRELVAVTPPDCHVFEYAWSPDGTRFAALTASHPNPAEGWYTAQIHVVGRDSGVARQICTMPHQIGRLAWSPDGQSIAFVSGLLSDEGNVSGEVYTVAAGGGEAVCITPGLDHSVTWIDWRDAGILYGGRHIDSVIAGWIDPANGSARTIFTGMFAFNGVGPQVLDAARNGTFVVLRESFAEPPNVYLGTLDTGTMRPLTAYAVGHPQIGALRVENKHWLGRDGQPVHGYLIFPPDYDPSNRYPLFAHVHGGPSWSYVPRFLSHWERVLTARGCLVLMPNPRGSWGRGNAFQAANLGDLGGGDWQDIDAGVDCMVEQGLADPARLAVGGWSYGGYLTTWAVTQTNRFRCAIAGASITSYESNYGVVSNREWQTTMFGSHVYDDYDLHRARSPMAHADKVTTPTLLVHGMLDVHAPHEQSIEFYQALKHFGVPASLVLYPREPHGFQERAHQIDLYKRLGAWVDTYLKG